MRVGRVPSARRSLCTHGRRSIVPALAAALLAAACASVPVPRVPDAHDQSLAARCARAYAALDAAADDPLNTIASVKRLMGRGLADVARLADHLPYEFAAGDSGMPRLRTAAGERSPV